jgi:hypothetical protein
MLGFGRMMLLGQSSDWGDAGRKSLGEVRRGDAGGIVISPKAVWDQLGGRRTSEGAEPLKNEVRLKENSI